MNSFHVVWRNRSARAKFGLLAVAVLCLAALGSAIAEEEVFGGSRDPSVQLAAKIVGIEQLVADYVQNADWGPSSVAPKGVNDPDAVGSLFTPTGNFVVLYWNAGDPVPLKWHSPNGGPSYDHCDNVGPAAVARFFATLGPRTTTSAHHVISNLQIHVDPEGKTGTVRGSMWITLGQTNEDATGGKIVPIWTGRYFGNVRLTSQGWKFDYWAPIVDQPIETPGCYANNKKNAS